MNTKESYCRNLLVIAVHHLPRLGKALIGVSRLIDLRLSASRCRRRFRQRKRIRLRLCFSIGWIGDHLVSHDPIIVDIHSSPFVSFVPIKVLIRRFTNAFGNLVKWQKREGFFELNRKLLNPYYCSQIRTNERTRNS